jgi:hypothetical protein
MDAKLGRISAKDQSENNFPPYIEISSIAGSCFQTDAKQRRFAFQPI